MPKVAKRGKKRSENRTIMREKRTVLVVLAILLCCSLLAMAERLAWSSLSFRHLYEPAAPPDTVRMLDVEIEDETIPDSLLHPRWPVQRTTPVTFGDLEQGSYDLVRPENIKQTVEYNDTLDRYIIGNKIGGTWVNTPIMMTPEEYRQWSEKRSFADYYRSKNQEILKNEGFSLLISRSLRSSPRSLNSRSQRA